MTNERGSAPTDRVWAVYHLHASEFPTTITLDQRNQDDVEPYVVTVGDGDVLCRLSDDETSWLLKKKVGIR